MLHTRVCEGTTTTLTNAALVPEARRLTDRYDFLAELGRGGMGIVYLARDRSNRERVAIKLLGVSAGDMSGGERTDAALRFAREARTVAGLQHPNIVRTLAIEELDGDTIAIVTAYVPGQNLRAVLRDAGPFPFGRASMVLRDIASALAYAHQLRIVHRDVKPENIFVEESGTRALLADFGIARPIDADVQITSDGSSLGTPAYMAPEQVKGSDVNERADVYSLGLVGWEMLTGHRPWEGETLYDVLHKQQHERLPSLAQVRPDIPAYLLTAIEGAIGKRPEERWANGAALLAQLTPMPAALPPRRPRDERSWWDEQTVQVGRPAAPVPIVATTAEMIDAPIPERVAKSVDAPPGDRMRERVVEPAVPTARPTPRSPRPRRVTSEKLKVWGPMLTAIMAAAVAWVMLGGKQAPQAVEGLPPKSAVEYPVLDTARVLEKGRVAAPPESPNPSVRRTTTATSAGTLSPDGATPPAATARVTPPRSKPPVAAPRVAARPVPRSPARAAPPTRTANGESTCSTPTNSAQRACLIAEIERNDAALNRTYLALISEMRREAGGVREPATVRALRVEQRAWVNQRDGACRSEGVSSGSLWGAERAPCFAQWSDSRDAVLRRRLDERTGRE